MALSTPAEGLRRYQECKDIEALRGLGQVVSKALFRQTALEAGIKQIKVN